MPLIQDAFRVVDNKNKLAVALVQHCSDCETTYDEATALYNRVVWAPDPARLARIKQESMSTAYYLEWDGRKKQARACFGNIHVEESNWDGREVLHRTALFKRAPGVGDWDRFGKKDFGEEWAKFTEHLYTHHFDPAQLSLMLTQSGALPMHTTAWSYFEEA